MNVLKTVLLFRVVVAGRYPSIQLTLSETVSSALPPQRLACNYRGAIAHGTPLLDDDQGVLFMFSSEGRAWGTGRTCSQLAARGHGEASYANYRILGPIDVV